MAALAALRVISDSEQIIASATIITDGASASSRSVGGATMQGGGVPGGA
jgi:hypothetical protein